MVKATWTKWHVSFSPTLPYPNSLKGGVGPSYHVMTITWCGGQPRGCPGGEPKRAATYRMADGISVEHIPTKLKLLTCL